MIEQTARGCPAAANAVEAGLCSAILSENRAEILEHGDDLAGAEAGLRTMIAERGRVLPATDKLVVQAWLYLIAFLGRHGRTADQEAAVATAERLALADPAQAQDALSLMHAHANLLFTLGRPAASVELYRRAIAFARATPGVVLSPALELDLAGTLRVNGENDALVALTSEMLAPARAPTLDPVSRLRAAALLGSAVERPEQARAALPLLEAARARETSAVDTAVQLAFLNGLATATIIAGDAAKGLSLAEEAERLAERSGGLRGKLLVQLFQVQAGALERLGRVDDASTVLGRARTLLAPTELAERANLAVIMAANLNLAGRGTAAKATLIGAAEEALRAEASRDKAYALARVGSELDHLAFSFLAQQVCREAVRLDGSGFHLGSVWLSRALLCLANSQLEIAPAAAHEAAVLADKVLRTSAADVPLAMQRAIQTDLLFSSRNDNKLPEAIEHAHAVLALSRQMQEPAGIAEAFWYLASVQRRMGRYEAALASAEQGLSVVPATASETRAALLNGRGLVQLYQHRPAEALATQQEALALRRDLRPAKPILVAEAEGNVASVLADLGRTEEAARYLDEGLDIYRHSDDVPPSTLVDALVRRARLAEQLGNRAGDEATLREALAAATSIGGPKAAAISFSLAAALDRNGEFTEASALRTAALTAVSSRFGADSREMAALRLDEAAALQSRGLLHDAVQAIAGCEAQARDQIPLLLPCLSEQASLLLAEGEPGRADAIATRAVQVAETSGEADPSAILSVPLLLQAKAAAGVGDAARASASLDRLRTLLQHDPAALARLALTRGLLLTEAGNPAGAEAALREAEASDDLAVLVGVTQVRSAGLIATGKPKLAQAAWDALLPRLDAAPRLRLSALESLGQVALAQWRFRAAATLFGDARTISVRLDGTFNREARDLAIAQAQAHARAGDLPGASSALASLNSDPSPLTAFLREDALASAASDAGDRVSALVHAQEALRRAKIAFSGDGFVVALARLKLATAQTLSGDAPSPADLERAIATIEDRTVSWSVSYMIERIHGVLAGATGHPALAEAAFERAEKLAAEHAGPDSVLAALARANRAIVQLDQGDAKGADALLRQALNMASPLNEPHGPVWASIALAASRAARRLGDTARAARLETEALRILPLQPATPRRYWL